MRKEQRLFKKGERIRCISPMGVGTILGKDKVYTVFQDQETDRVDIICRQGPTYHNSFFAHRFISCAEDQLIKGKVELIITSNLIKVNGIIIELLTPKKILVGEDTAIYGYYKNLKIFKEIAITED